MASEMGKGGVRLGEAVLGGKQFELCGWQEQRQICSMRTHRLPRVLEPQLAQLVFCQHDVLSAPTAIRHRRGLLRALSCAPREAHTARLVFMTAQGLKEIHGQVCKVDDTQVHLLRGGCIPIHTILHVCV